MNPNRGPEDVSTPFKKRRHRPGDRANGTDRCSYHPVAVYFSAHATSVLHAAKIATRVFRVPPGLVRGILGDPKRNSIKYARLVQVTINWWDDVVKAKKRHGLMARQGRKEFEDGRRALAQEVREAEVHGPRAFA